MEKFIGWWGNAKTSRKIDAQKFRIEAYLLSCKQFCTGLGIDLSSPRTRLNWQLPGMGKECPDKI